MIISSCYRDDSDPFLPPVPLDLSFPCWCAVYTASSLSRYYYLASLLLFRWCLGSSSSSSSCVITACSLLSPAPSPASRPSFLPLVMLCVACTGPVHSCTSLLHKGARCSRLHLGLTLYRGSPWTPRPLIKIRREAKENTNRIQDDIYSTWWCLGGNLNAFHFCIVFYGNKSWTVKILKPILRFISIWGVVVNKGRRFPSLLMLC